MEQRKRKISAATRLAISCFTKIEQIEYRKEILLEELKGWILRIPEDEIDVYMEITDKIIEEFERKRSRNPKLRGYIYNIQK